ncbi:hypothetical protein GCM10011390_13340 [Aureimonas endophytica]|uniref:Glycosyl transferase family 2 n=1 Tax=Aureimonas endophytica TaxID=2027858 RepID=A0A916ZGH5_9HYPH|nr:glycosyltransferase family 2 protein [Aureimonas endophytica]GGD95917.1 hypothetical protein GCM10011390_13340 [Aureimonas endophytica]
MNRLSPAAIDLAPGEVPVVTLVKNEMGFLPHFLRHYRKLGVASFIFIDNGSTDGSLEFLLAEDDCHVFQELGAFRAANYGIDWVNEVANAHCVGRWSAFVDCDELLVYRDCETVPLADFCAGFTARGFDKVGGAMIDMYPDGDFLAVSLGPQDDLLEVMGNFDSDYVFRAWPRRPWDAEPESFHLQVLGGPRLRLLSDLGAEAGHGALYYTLCNQVDRFIDKVPLSWVGPIAALWPMEMPAQQKWPINFVRPGFAFANSHANRNTAPADEFVSLLHFKLCDELRKRVQQNTLMEAHYRRGLSYEQLRRAVLRWGPKPLVYEGTRRFRSSKDLEAIGLIGPAVAGLWSGKARTEVRTPLGDSGRAYALAAASQSAA